MGMDDAYAVQAALVRRKLQAGRQGDRLEDRSHQPSAMQYALNIDHRPTAAFCSTTWHSTNGATIPADRFIQPRIEAEIAFVMRAPISPGANVTREDVIAATDYVVPSLEILDTRILRADPDTGQARKICDTISDNAANAGLVLGNGKHAVDAFDLRWVGAIVSRNGEVEETGLGAGVLNDPVTGIVWLAHRMAVYGQRIEAGQVILSGSFIRPIEAPSGSAFEADFGNFGSVSVSFS
jgi:2-oxo-hept-3-ene-1,7-dioate hydratase